MRTFATEPSVTLVIPVFNEEAVLEELFRRLTALFDQQSAINWCALLVNDGSRDRSTGLLRAQASCDLRLQALELKRNFCFQAALVVGLAHAAGDAVITLDADLQDPPEIIPVLVARWREGADLVRAVRRSRQETGVRRAGMDLFHGMFGRLTDFPFEANTGTIGLMDREAVDALNSLPERRRFSPRLRSWVSFTIGEVHYDRHERAAGVPQQTLVILIRYALDGVFSFSYLPLRMLTYCGILTALVGFAAAVFYTFRRIMGIETAPTGYTTLATTVLFLGGVKLIGIGVLGEYLGRIYDEVKRRPLYVVRRESPPQ